MQMWTSWCDKSNEIGISVYEYVYFSDFSTLQKSRYLIDFNGLIINVKPKPMT